MKSNSKYVYVVDDNKFNLTLLNKIIQNATNSHVRSFSNAEDCLKEIEKRVPDLILSDYYLDEGHDNKLNGDSLLKQIKSNHPNIPVIMYSSKKDIDMVVDLIKSGAADFIERDSVFVSKIKAAAEKAIMGPDKVPIHKTLGFNLFLVVASMFFFVFLTIHFNVFFLFVYIIFFFTVTIPSIIFSIDHFKDHLHHH